MEWMRRIPGFRTGTRWKQVVAVFGYLMIIGFFLTDVTGMVFALLGLLWVAILTNFEGFRDRLPLLSAQNRGKQATGVAGLGLASLIALGIAAPSVEEAGDGPHPAELSLLSDAVVEPTQVDLEREEPAEEPTSRPSATTIPFTSTPKPTVEPTEVPTTAIPPTVTPVPATPTSAPPTEVPSPVPPTDPPAPVVSVVIGVAFYDGAVSRTEDDEYIEIVNQGSQVNLSGWSLSDSDGNVFNFPGFDLAPGQRCRVYTNEYHPQHCGFSFGSTKAIWGNKGDTASLRDPSGNVVSQKSW